jgi:hypothetical protein
MQKGDGMYAQKETVFVQGYLHGPLFAVRVVDEAGNMSGLHPSPSDSPPSRKVATEGDGCGSVIVQEGTHASGSRIVVGLSFFGYL